MDTLRKKEFENVADDEMSSTSRGYVPAQSRLRRERPKQPRFMH
jgi:hypothetical protein